MITVDSVVQVISTPRKEYSEGPIFFKRKGIYYYLYTIGGDEKYQYAYVMSRVSPMGPFEAPEQDIISTTNYERGIFGPGHGCVFHPEGTDNYYFAYLEFGRRSTNRPCRWGSCRAALREPARPAGQRGRPRIAAVSRPRRGSSSAAP